MILRQFVSPANSIFSALILSLGVVVGALDPVTYAQEAPDPAANVDEAAYDQARSISAAFHQTAQRTLPAAVTIIVKKNLIEKNKGDTKLPFSDLIPDLEEKIFIESGGSGFLVDPSGVIVTNSHVVREYEVGKAISVELNDGRRFPAKTIVRDDKSDVAVVTIEAPEPLPFLTFADSSSIKIGDWVLAIGNPFMLGSSVSAGIISATERVRDSKLFLQTDAAINPGNSGGPLVNLRGEVVGINTAIASLSGGYQGVGFAIPANTAKWIAAQLREKGKVERAFLGAPMSIIEYNEARRLNLPTLTGVRISSPFKDSPAAKAGLRANDVLISLDNQPIESPLAFEMQIERIDVNRDFKLKVLRNNSSEPIELTIRFEIRPDGYVGVPLTEKLVEKGAHKVDREWGIMVVPSTPNSAARIGAGDRSGLVVLNVTPGSQAYRAGVRNGSMILKINGQAVQTLEEYDASKENCEENEAELEVWQKGEIIKVRLVVKNEA